MDLNLRFSKLQYIRGKSYYDIFRVRKPEGRYVIVVSIPKVPKVRVELTSCEALVPKTSVFAIFTTPARWTQKDSNLRRVVCPCGLQPHAIAALPYVRSI